MKLAIGIAAAWLLTSLVASAQSVSAERLQAMRLAAANLEYLIALKQTSGETATPSSPEVAKLLATICNPREAESLERPAVAQFQDIRQYARHLTTVMAAFTKPGPPLSGVLAPEVEPCIDADLWIGRTSLNLVERMFAERPAMRQDAKALDGRQKMTLSAIFQLRAVLRAFQLRGVVQPAWCEARMRPLRALAETVAKEVPPEHRETLRTEVRAAEACSAAAKPGLRLIHDKLAP